MKGIEEANASDFVLQDVMKIMKENDWERQKDRPRDQTILFGKI